MKNSLCLPYKKTKNLEISADIYSRSDDSGPAVIFLHGGALIWGSRKSIRVELVSQLLDRGFMVVSIDYRLAPATKIRNIIDDVQDAVEWVKRGCSNNVSLDPDRIGVLGNSAGGYLALCAGTFCTRPQAIASFYGYGSIVEDWYTRPSEHYLMQQGVSKMDFEAWTESITEKSSEEFSCFPYYVYIRQKGIWPEFVSGEKKQDLIQYCPVENVDSQYPPTFLTHGTEDLDVSPTTSERMFETLSRVGVPCELHMLQGRGHAFDRNEDDPETKRMTKATVDFFEKYLIH